MLGLRKPIIMAYYHVFYITDYEEVGSFHEISVSIIKKLVFAAKKVELILVCLNWYWQREA